MTATGLGASVKRKEDIRFITGKGRYVDDINRPGQVRGGIAQSMPRADGAPSFDVDAIQTPCPSNPLGVKGCGEAGAIARRPLSSTRSPTRSATTTSPCPRHRPRSGRRRRSGS